MKIKQFLKCTICLLLIIFILFGVFCSLAQEAHANTDIMIRISDYDNYLEIIEQLDLPSYYVRYEHIQVLGEYKGYTGPDYVSLNDSWYLFEYRAEYLVTDKNNQSLTFIMAQKNLIERPQNKLRMSLVSADMRTVNTDESGIIVRGPLRYRYYGGQLRRIDWNLGYVDFYVHATHDYPTDAEKTIYSRLLSRNYFTALFAYYELVWDIPLQPGETWLGRMQHLIWPPVILILLIAACITAIWFIRRIRRKKAAMFPTQWHNRRYKNSATDDTEN